MKIFLFIFLILLCGGQGIAQVLSSQMKLDVGWELPNNLVSRKKNITLHQTFTDIFDPFIRKEIDDVYYTIAYDKNTQLISYINTSDFAFKTEDGRSVGDILTLTKEQISFQPGWEVYGPTTSDGWKPVIGYNRAAKTHSYEFGKIAEPGDPRDGFKKLDKIKVKILSFSKTR